MKKIVLAASIVSLSLGLVSCGGAKGEDPGTSYMPDMYYARAYEAYGYNMVEGEWDSLRQRGISYNAMNVPGTVARGELLPYHVTAVDTALAEALPNPMDTAAKKDAKMLKEGERLFLINCGICHGPALDGNGPIYKDGNGPYPVKPTALNDAKAKSWTDGHYYYIITFGKGAMGSYASQLKPEQRWMVVNYIRSKQGGGSVAKDTTATTAAATPNAMTTNTANDTTNTQQP